MISWEMVDTQKTVQNRINEPIEQLRYTEIDNYYGAHKNFKTDFRNKKYKNVYMQLIHRKPAQPEHKALYFQDLLISIIKTLQTACLGKEAHVGPIEPFFHFGTKAIRQFYWLFLMERRIIDREMAIDPGMQSKIGNFLTLIVDFCCKIAQYLNANGNVVNAQRIFQNCYENIVKGVINSSTSNVFLLKKCGQFLLQYSSYCLKNQKIGRAHQLLKDGLKIQLNQLILLKHCLKRNNKHRKYQRRYSTALKTLTHFYLSLGIVYEKQNKMYDCAIAVLDAVMLEEFICFYRSKTKKWICNLEDRYLDDKNRYLEAKRICDHYFQPDYLKELAKRSSSSLYQKGLLPTVPQQLARRRKNLNKNSTDTKFILYNDSNTKEENEKEKIKGNKSKRNDKSIKEVRFKLNDEEIGNKMERGDRDGDKGFQGLVLSQRASNLSLKQNAAENQNLFGKTTSRKSLRGIPSECEQSSAHQLPQEQPESAGKIKQKSKSVGKKSIEALENNQFFLFGQNFWQPKQPSKRSKSSFEKLKSRHQFQVKRVGRKLSYNNISCLQASKYDNKNKRCNEFLKQGYKQAGLRKKANRDKGLYFQNGHKNPYKIQDAEKRIEDWHKKSAKMETDLVTKLGRLKQRKNTRNGLEIAELASYIDSEPSEEESRQINLQKIEHDLAIKRKQLTIKKNKKQTGIGTFKQFLLENKNYFGISKVELFSSTCDLEGQKRYLSFLVAEKPEKREKFVERNHWQAKNNVEYFMREIESSNKKLSHSRNKKCKSKLLETAHKSPSPQEYSQASKLSSLQIQPSNLFGTSLKSRAQQLVKLL